MTSGRARRAQSSPLLASVADVLESVRGVTRWPLIFRCSMIACAVGAALLAAVGAAAPVFVVTIGLLTLALAGAGALFPESPAPLVVQLALVGEVVATRGSDPAAWFPGGVALLGVSCLAYLHHASAAMAAALPWQASPRTSALAAFARRTAAVLGLTLAVGVLVLAVAGGVHGRGPSLLSLFGLALAAAVGLLPALLLRRLR
jgi:hypothetical protein